MSKQIDALKLALETLEYWHVRDEFSTQTSKAITAIKEALAEQPAQGCDYCNNPQYAGIKCKNCGREQPAQQEPVACPDGRQCKHGAWCTETYCQEHCEFRAPPQRKPLPFNKEDMEGLDVNQRLGFKLGWKSAEEAHGIKE